MKLREFVSQTLQEIIQGVHDAQASASEFNAVINPRDPNTEPHYRPVNVDFDVAITASDETSSEAGAGIVVLSFGLGGKQQSEVKQQSTNRITFSVPVTLPASKP